MITLISATVVGVDMRLSFLFLCLFVLYCILYVF